MALFPNEISSLDDSLNQPLDILYEDNHLLVINKPAPLATMGVAADETSLVTLAKDYLRIKYNKPGKVFLGVVSRLDSFVTGAIVLARTSKAASRLSEQFRSRTIEKTYWAIVADPLPNSTGTLEHRLLKNESRHRMETLPQRSKSVSGEQQARLHYLVIGQSNPFSLLEIQLETGRKHQIRVQLEAIGCSIVGDRKYGSERTFQTGIALHSRRLMLQHPTTKEPLSFDAKVPNGWKLKRFGNLG